MFQEFMEQHQDTCVTIVRAPAVVGPQAGLCGFSVLLTPVMVRVIGCDPRWQFVHEDDIAELILTLLGRKQGGVFNAAGDGSLHYGEVIAAAGRPSIALPAGLLSVLVDVSWRLHLQRSSPVGGLEFTKHAIVISTEKLKSATGFRFRYSSREALQSYLDATKAASSRAPA